MYTITFVLSKNYQHEMKRISDFLEIPVSMFQMNVAQFADIFMEMVQTIIKTPSADGSFPIYRKGLFNDLA